MQNSARGFTLIELMVVVALIALGTAGVSFALRDSNGTRLEREGHRLAALLEAARAQSRASGVAVRWQAKPSGFTFDGLPGAPLPTQWLNPDVSAESAKVVLGPDPVLPPTQIVLSLTSTTTTTPSAFRVRVSTDGVRPFRVEPIP